MKYKWHYIDGYIPFHKSHQITLGSLVHTCFEMFYSKFSNADIIDYIRKQMDEEISKCSPSEAEDAVLAKYTALGMWHNFPSSLDNFLEVKPEMEFRVLVIPQVYFVGKIDGLVKDKENRLWVREIKTTSLSFSQFERRAKTSPQATGYIWAMRKLGHPVVGVMYDFIKKPLLRKTVTDDMHAFGYRIMADYKARPELYFKRHFTYRNDEELGIYEEDLKKTAKDILNRCKTHEWYRNPDQCWNFNTECTYAKICFQNQPDQLTLDLYYSKEPRMNKGGDTDDAST